MAANNTASLSIFYDLETTDINPLGQILNFCFTAVDRKFCPVDELAGTIKVSRLQLPSAQAMLANRTDILEHQRTAQWSEPEAMQCIVNWISGILKQTEEKVPFIGYNSARFDLPFLRTSLIRNGFNPYFDGKLLQKDLYLAVKKSMLCHKKFQALMTSGAPSDERVSIRLEEVARRTGILSGEQTHNSSDDVQLTIGLARLLAESFSLDVRFFESYEARELDGTCGTGKVFRLLSPALSSNAGADPKSTPLTLLDQDHRAALWINLEGFKSGKGREAVRWFNKGGGSAFFTDGTEDTSAEWRERAALSLKELKEVKLANFFRTSTCDIEQDIYRLDFDAIEALSLAIWKGDKRALAAHKNRDSKVVFMRHELAGYDWDGSRDDLMRRRLKEYALYRYGGRAKLVKNNAESQFQEGVYSDDFHATFNELLSEISKGLEQANDRQKGILCALQTFYLDSDINKIAGTELREINRK